NNRYFAFFKIILYIPSRKSPPAYPIIKAIDEEIYVTPSKLINEALTAKATNSPTIPERNIITKK
ncbi:MAG: hypothetical protein WC319_15560, partial [Candidatus Paceibacterota bacterium]